MLRKKFHKEEAKFQYPSHKCPELMRTHIIAPFFGNKKTYIHNWKIPFEEKVQSKYQFEARSKEFKSSNRHSSRSKPVYNHTNSNNRAILLPKFARKPPRIST